MTPEEERQAWRMYADGFIKSPMWTALKNSLNGGQVLSSVKAYADNMLAAEKERFPEKGRKTSDCTVCGCEIPYSTHIDGRQCNRHS